MALRTTPDELEDVVDPPAPRGIETPDRRGGRRGGGGTLLDPLPATRPGLHAVAIATYLGVSLIWWAHVWFGGNPAHAITCNCGDTTQQVWWLEWLPWAVLHGHNPLLTNAIWARFGGANALTNTSWFVPGALLAPVTVLFGPVASFNVANLLAPVVSGWAAFTLAGHVSRRTGARLVAGALYAFSPFMLRNTVLGHIDLTITPYLPLVLLLGIGLLRRGARPVRSGVVLGVLTVLQFFTGLEVLAITAVTAGVGAVVVGLTRPRLIAAARRPLVVAGAIAAGISAVVLAYPLWFFLDGPRHVKGPFWPVASSIPQAIVKAGPNVHSTHTALVAVGYLGPQGPDTDYLGFGLLVFVVLSIPFWRRRFAGRVLAVVGVACWGLEFMPSTVWARLPLVSSIEVIRFALPVSLCVGMLLGASIDGWWRLATTGRAVARRAGRSWAARAGVGALVGLAFWPLVDTYSIPFRVSDATVPAWFAHDAGRLPAGTAVMTVPLAFGIASTPMAWQAEAHDSFDLVGGWALVPGGNGVNDQTISPLEGPVPALQALSNHPGDLTTAQQESIRAAVSRWRPLAVVVVPGHAPAGIFRAVTDTLGLAPRWSDGAWVWLLTRTTALGPLTPITSG